MHYTWIVIQTLYYKIASVRLTAVGGLIVWQAETEAETASVGEPEIWSGQRAQNHLEGAKDEMWNILPWYRQCQDIKVKEGFTHQKWDKKG